MTRRRPSIRKRLQVLDRRTVPRGSTNVTETPKVAPPGHPPPLERETVIAAVPRLLRFPDVRNRTGLSRSTIWRLERDGRFPRHRRISANAVAWPEDEVLAWIRIKIAT